MRREPETPTSPYDYFVDQRRLGRDARGRAEEHEGRRPEARASCPCSGSPTFALSKALAKEKVGTWARAPVVDEEVQRPKGRGLRYAVGELLTCTRCVGTWSALGLVGLRVARPREGRIVASVLATAGINDWLQAVFSATTSKANAEKKLATADLEDWPSVVDAR